MDTMPSNHEILCYLLGESTGHGGMSAADVQRAIEQNGETGARAGILQAMLGDLGRAANLESLFDVASPRLSRLAQATLPGKVGTVSIVDRLIASTALLTFDSWKASPALSGFRGNATSRDLKFAAEGWEIDLQITLERAAIAGLVSGTVTVVGRVSGSHVACKASLIWPEGTRLESEVDSEGFFEFSVETGQFQLLLEGESGSVSVPNLMLEMD